MKKKDRQAYIQAIKPLLSEKRFEHSLNVAQEAVKLAKKYGADPEKAEAAGILHDILKDTPADKQLKIISDFGIIMNDVELSVKKSWHAISGAAYIRGVLRVEDEEIIDAVRYHTTGRHNMTVLERLFLWRTLSRRTATTPVWRKCAKQRIRALIGRSSRALPSRSARF